MTPTEQFLDLYKRIENELEKRYEHGKRKYSSVVFEFIRDQESEPIRDGLEICREIRNLLTHSANVGGVPVVEPSLYIVEMMGEILKYVEAPPLALEFATRGEQILKAKLSQKALRLMEVMSKNGFSHVPVTENGELFGVFSAGVIFQFTLNSNKRIDKETTLAELKEYISINGHYENYAFLPKSTTYMEARKTFQHIKARNRRVSVAFITETGKQNEPLLGMVTPWDVLGNH